MRSRIGIGALEIVDEQHVAAAADLLHAVRQTGKTAQAVLQGFAGPTPSASAQADAQRRILRIVQAAQRTDAADPTAISLRAPPEARQMISRST